MDAHLNGMIRWSALVVMLVVLAACGGDADPGEAADDDAPEETAEEAADDGAQDDDTAVDEDADEEEAATDDDVEAGGGTIVFGAEQEPAIANPATGEGALGANAIVTLPVLQPLWRLTPDFEYELLLLAEEPEITEDPFTVTYTVRDDAEWSDGTPITASDIEFTWEVKTDPDLDIFNRSGYEDITEAEILDDKSIRFTFEEPFAAWQTLFSSHADTILPRHALEGEDLTSVWQDAIEVSSGPFLWDDWERGQHLTLVPNENYWGDVPQVDQVVFRFIEESGTLVQLLRSGEIDMAAPQPQIELVEQIEQLDGLVLETETGMDYEHIKLNHRVAPLDDVQIRAAIAKGVDRDSIVDLLIGPINPDAEATDNLMYRSIQPEYEPNWADALAYDPDGAVELLENAGCERGDDEIFSCDGERLEFDYTSTTGNERRQLTFEIIQAQLAEIGIELHADFTEAADLFGTRLWDYDFEFVSFGDGGAPNPQADHPKWVCDGEQNWMGYCNEEATDLLRQASVTIDDDERAQLYNEADRMMAEEVAVMPIYETPTLLIWSDRISGPRINATQWGPTWNMEEWTVD